MPFDGFPNGKPAAWELAPELTDAPELWRKVVMVAPYWEGTGAVTQIFGRRAKVGTITDVPWASGTRGIGLIEAATDGDGILLDSSLPECDVNTAGASFSVVLVGESSAWGLFANNRYAAGTRGPGSNVGWSAQLNGTTMRITFFGVADYSMGNLATNTGFKVLGWDVVRGGTSRSYENGTQRGTASSGTGTNATNNCALLALNNQGSLVDAVNGTFFAQYIFEPALTAEEHAFLARDPFAIIRPRDDSHIPAIFGDLGGGAANQEHTIPQTDFTFTPLAPSHFVDQIHTLPVADFSYEALAPTHSVGIIHTLPVVDFSYAVLAPTHSVSSDFTAHGVEFDGTNDWLSHGSGLTGAADGKAVTICGWFNVGNIGSTAQLLAATKSGATKLSLELLSSGRLRILGLNSAGATILNISSGNTGYDDGEWHFLAASFDLADTENRRFFVDDVDDIGSVVSYTNDDIELGGADAWSVGAFTNGLAKLPGCMGELWVDDSYINFVVEANRRKFYGADGQPVDLGSDGSTPTGSAPLIYLGGNGQEAAGWEVNKGGGGGFTENGALTDCATDPGHLVNIEHELTVKAYTYAVSAPTHLINMVHTIPEKAYDYNTLSPQHLLTLNHTIPVKEYTYTVNPPVHFKDEVHSLVTKNFTLDLLAPTHTVAGAIDHLLPELEFVYGVYAPQHVINQIHALPVVDFEYAVLAPAHGIAIRHLLARADFAYQTYAPIHIGQRTNIIDINSLDLTPPRELSRETQYWLINNFTILQDILRGGVTGNFETSDGRILVIKNGIVETIYTP